MGISSHFLCNKKRLFLGLGCTNIVLVVACLCSLWNFDVWACSMLWKSMNLLLGLDRCSKIDTRAHSMLRNLMFVYSLKIYRFIQKLDSRVKKLKINRWDYFVRIINSIFQSGQLRIIKKSPQKSFHRHFILGEKRVKIGLTKMEK